ncbi:hypothetical protein A3H19_00430 [Candidatus Woesebacteria bacterium RIFCSPLOWO2_12_FULL_39_9]|nr:MAG: hypothetical protein A3H19_00430 [Candidatus Woesebacteria bacterium RIFCSPLOWO2_12_FULL_39_9]
MISWTELENVEEIRLNMIQDRFYLGEPAEGNGKLYQPVFSQPPTRDWDRDEPAFLGVLWDGDNEKLVEYYDEFGVLLISEFYIFAEWVKRLWEEGIVRNPNIRLIDEDDEGNQTIYHIVRGQWTITTL